MDTGIVKIHGKDYQTVALRIQKFREQYPDWGITSEVLYRDEDSVVVKSTITDTKGRVLATGLAEEFRASSKINSTSALENAETSAHGRALAALGLGGTEFASANEVQGAIAIQAEKAKQYQDAYLPGLREAALKGEDELNKAFKALPQSPYKEDFWKAHGPALKAAAGIVK